MNGINAFSTNTQIPWILQAVWILLTLGSYLVYALYMLNKNSLLSVIGCFLVVAEFYVALLPKLVPPIHFCVCSDSSAQKRIRSHHDMADFHDSSAFFWRHSHLTPCRY